MLDTVQRGTFKRRVWVAAPLWSSQAPSGDGTMPFSSRKSLSLHRSPSSCAQMPSELHPELN